VNIKHREVIGLPNTEAALPVLIQKLYYARGLKEADFLVELSGLLPFDTLLNIEIVTQRLMQALQQQQRILVVGDFDADGATASALAVSALEAMGAKHVQFLVPNRFEFGYGLTTGLVEHAKMLSPDIIITVDNGIANLEGVERAQALGMDVIITDHHLAGDLLPNTPWIINPNQPNCQFPSKALAGVGVIFYVMSALRRALIQSEWFVKQSMDVPNMAHFLDLVALGTIADVVPLDKNNRIMVKYGLLRIQSGAARPGIMSLLQVAGRNFMQATSSDLGFYVGPRINAAGRLDDMSIGIQCLIAETMQDALSKAKMLDDFNRERREIEDEMKVKALEDMQISYGVLANIDQLPAALCLHQESFHQGVIGILAGRLKEKFKKPTIVFALGQEGELKGSARSIEGLNIRDALANIDLKHPGLLLKFGGHAMAAGLSITKQNFEIFKKAFIDEVEAQGIESQDVIWTDGALLADDFHLQTVQWIQKAGPWGQHFPEPNFDNVFKVIEQRIVGQKHLKLILQPLNHTMMLDAIAFNVEEGVWPNHRCQFIHAVYQLDINHYQGRQKIQLRLQQFEETYIPSIQFSEVS
jgi:single-stranded-DNA-specific exonuclease